MSWLSVSSPMRAFTARWGIAKGYKKIIFLTFDTPNSNFIPLPSSFLPTFVYTYAYICALPLPTPTPTFLPLPIHLYILGDDQDPWDVIQPAGDRVGFDLQVQIQVPVFQCFLKSFSVFWGGLFLTDPHSGKPAFLKRMSVSSLTSLSAPRCILSGSLSSQL